MREFKYYPTKKYRPRDLTEQQLMFCEAYLAEGIGGKAASIAGYKNPSRAGGYLLQTKRIKDYLAHRMKSLSDVGVTYEKKLGKIKTVIDSFIPEEGELKPDKVKVGLSAIQEANRMQGHYAPTQNQNLNVNLNGDIDSAKEIAARLNSKNRYKKDY